MNSSIDDIFNLFPAWFYLSPTSLDNYGVGQCHLDNHGLPGSIMLEGYDSNPAVPAFIPPTPTLSFNDVTKYASEAEILCSPLSSLSSSSSSLFSTCQKPSSVKRNTRIGYCEHPKHVFYRQFHGVSVTNSKYIHRQLHYPHCHHKKHCQKHICKKLCRHHHFLHHLNQQLLAPPSDISSMATTPRRGRPPKGTKLFEREPCQEPGDLTLSIAHHTDSLGLHHLENDNNNSSINYHITMTTRPLPKRLEPVVGKSNIYVCLTCLKRSDMDVDYLMDPAYIGPQSSKEKKSPPNLA